ncbi:MAG: MotA/TolQ/ExbB proton channel family protein [Symploca sp. SIO2C1]|nr:MotA/TolQ/ExbB proton channel family protein [Symploca sp. SIO2C1]
MPISVVPSLGGIVYLPLLALSMLAFSLIFERLVFWLRVIKRQNLIIREVLKLYQQDYSSSLRKLEQNSDLPIARIFLAALSLKQPTPEKFRLALETAAQAELPVLRRFSTVFETIISIAPLLGLLGTILGLVEAFSGLMIGDIGGSDTITVTAGLSDALITTVAGLSVAIFTLLFANTFRGLYRRQLAAIQEYGGQLELLYLNHYQGHKEFRI